MKVNDCVAIYLNGALIDDDEILEEIDKSEVLVILRDCEMFNEILDVAKNNSEKGNFGSEYIFISIFIRLGFCRVCLKHF